MYQSPVTLEVGSGSRALTSHPGESATHSSLKTTVSQEPAGLFTVFPANWQCSGHSGINTSKLMLIIRHSLSCQPKVTEQRESSRTYPRASGGDPTGSRAVKDPDSVGPKPLGFNPFSRILHLSNADMPGVMVK